MIAYLRGTLIESTFEFLIVDVGGVGYRVYIPTSILGRLPEKGKEVIIHTYYYVREDIMALYGFLAINELELFENLISVSGIGPKVAMGMLSSIASDNLVQAVVQEDLKTLQNVPGIGKKTAQRLIIELKDKLAKTVLTKNDENSGGADMPTKAVPWVDDALQALLALGYQQGEAKSAVNKVVATEPNLIDPEQIIKLAFKELLKG